MTKMMMYMVIDDDDIYICCLLCKQHDNMPMQMGLQGWVKNKNSFFEEQLSHTSNPVFKDDENEDDTQIYNDYNDLLWSAGVPQSKRP